MHPLANTRAFVALATLMFFGANAAHAKPSSVFMLQFGSFETASEANERLSSLKTKHSGIIGSLPTRVLDVALPDNLTVYRTQAGPVASRADAQALCGQLASTGDECYVVETAMNMPVVAPIVSVPVLKEAVAPVAKTSERSLIPVASAAATNSVDMPNVKALDNAPNIKTAPSSPSIRPVVKTRDERPSFWSSLNPFSDEDETLVAPDRAQRSTAPTLPPVRTPERPSVRMEEPEVKAPAPVVSVPKVNAPELRTPVVAAPVVTTSAPSTLPRVMLPAKPATRTVASAVSMDLPPPPPLTGKARELFERNASRPAPRVPMATAEPLKPVTVSTSTSPFAPASAETLARLGKTPASAPMTSAPGAVKVGEATRVPLSQAKVTPAFKPSGSTVAPPDASTPIYPTGIAAPSAPMAAPEVALPPSGFTGKTLWAELGKFEDAAKALAFWDGFRNAHPDFPVVRVRVVQSYSEKVRGDNAVRLRVGPFAKPQSLTYLCNSVEDTNLSCREVTDMGISSAQTSGSRTLMGEANAARALQSSPRYDGQYWLQLGAYSSMAQAQNAWAELKRAHGNTLPGTEPNITTPAMHSATGATYRLRSGPFASQQVAIAACNKVKNAGDNCLVTSN